MISRILNYVSNLGAHTELLEALNWDDELMEKFIDELTTLLTAAPPNVEKALFWLKNTPWDCFGGAAIPDDVFLIVRKNILNAADKIIDEEKERKDKMYALPSINKKNDDTEWN